MSEIKQKKRQFLKPIETAVLALLATTVPMTVSAAPDTQSNLPVIQAVMTQPTASSVIEEPLLIKRADAYFSKVGHYSHSSHSSHSSHYSSSY